MKNVRYKPNIPTETRTMQSRTQITARNIEVAMYDLHRISDTYIAPNRGSLCVPAAADTPPGEWRGVGEVERDSQIRTITLVIVALSL